MLSAVFRRMGGLPVPWRGTLAAAMAHYSVQIVVPALGDSISDGTIAAVLKRSGDAVSENETIAQIETDKVTIDIKAPADGTILGVVVQEDDTVVPGQLVATLDDATARAKLVGAGAPGAQPTQADAPAAAATPPPPPPAAAAAAPAPAPAAGHGAAPAAHRVPGIRFPPRRTSDGRRVSMLPAAEAAAIVQQWRAAGGGRAAPGAAAAAAPAPASAAGAGSDPAAFAAWAATQRRAQEGGAAAGGADVPSKFATSVSRLTRMPARRELSERDMELIELGGAAP